MKNLTLPEKPKILVRGVDTVGTFVFATPFYRELRKNFPGAHITLCIKPLVYELAKGCPYVDEIIIYDKKKYSEFEFIKEIRKQKFDAAFILSGSFHSALSCCLAGIKTRIGYPHDHRGFLLTHKVVETEKKHCVEYLLDILVGIGKKIECTTPELWFDEKDLLAGQKILTDYGIAENDTIIGVGFGVAGEKAREWPLENWAELINSFFSKCSKIILFGTKNDCPSAEYLEKTINNKNLINLTGKTSLIEFAACVKQCKLYLSVDTGGIHIAAALGIPVIGLYIPGSDIRWCPRGNKVITISKNTDCSPCNQHKMRYCVENICMKKINAQEVYNAVISMLYENQ